MVFSSAGSYRATRGVLTLGGGKLTFTRTDGLFQKTQRVVVSIPTDAILTFSVEGTIRKRLVVLVDSSKMPGIPRHEFEVPDPYQWANAVQGEMKAARDIGFGQPPPQPSNTTYVKETIREIVKIPCPFCGTLVELTEPRCASCGAPLGRR